MVTSDFRPEVGLEIRQFRACALKNTVVEKRYVEHDICPQSSVSIVFLDTISYNTRKFGQFANI